MKLINYKIMREKENEDNEIKKQLRTYIIIIIMMMLRIKQINKIFK